MDNLSISGPNDTGVTVPVTFVFAINVKTYADSTAESVEQASLEALHQISVDGCSLTKVAVSISDQPNEIEESSQVEWSGRANVSLLLEDTSTQYLMDIETNLAQFELQDTSGICFDFSLSPIPGIMPEVEQSEEHSFASGVIGFARGVGDMITGSARRKPSGWYPHSDGGYRYWNGYEWGDETVDYPPHSQHFRP